MSICYVTSPSINQSICHATSLPIDPSVCYLTCPYVNMSVCPLLSPSDHPSLSNHLYAIFTIPSDCLSQLNCLHENFTSLSDCRSMSDHLYKTLTSPSACPPSVMTKHLHNSRQSLAVVNGKQSCKVNKFCRVFTNYDLLLHDLDVSSIYTSASRHLALPKSGEDSHVTHKIMGDLGEPILN